MSNASRKCRAGEAGLEKGSVLELEDSASIPLKPLGEGVETEPRAGAKKQLFLTAVADGDNRMGVPPPPPEYVPQKN
jgi:hypothetical protein